MNLEYKEAEARVAPIAIENYICTELHVRLIGYDLENKQNRIDRIKECLYVPLNDKQKS